ncbi:hypothetical protein MPUL_01860 [Mycolicibacterium pulveris]|uniref:Uncharacterized protein n=1 Tax=Mycolicibacterium pulveris TaxID=36813 RepID=A0A7I7UC45_MYCPV|nr:hypothetical protein MPUL_01860 [Mycolicibacterium pulveris]
MRRDAGLRRGADRDPLREPVFDMVERVPERAAVLLAMPASLVAIVPDTTSATLVTKGYLFSTEQAYRAET